MWIQTHRGDFLKSVFSNSPPSSTLMATPAANIGGWTCVWGGLPTQGTPPHLAVFRKSGNPKGQKRGELRGHQMQVAEKASQGGEPASLAAALDAQEDAVCAASLRAGALSTRLSCFCFGQREKPNHPSISGVGIATLRGGVAAPSRLC